MNVIFKKWNLAKTFLKMTPTSKNETTTELKEMVDK
jgi:hypothetical protein